MNDSLCSQVIKYCQSSWPEKHMIQSSLKPYWTVRGELTVCNNLLLFNKRIVVRESLKKETLDKIHEGHQEIQRSRFRATSSVWWPGLSKEIVQTVQKCEICVRKNTPPKEPLIPSKLPDHPWQKIGSDLFELEGVTYLLVVDYFFKIP